MYRRLEEIMLANSGENEFEEIFKIIIIKLWQDVHGFKDHISLYEANCLLGTIDKVWPGVLDSTNLKITEEQFFVCINIIKEYSFTYEDYEEVDGVFEYIVSREKKGSKGQYFTPRYIIDFCINILNPKYGESILDPASGSGAFLYHAYTHGNVNGYDLWGFDFDNTVVRISRLLMYIGRITGWHIYKVNSLINMGCLRSNIGNNIGDISPKIEDVLRIEKKKDLFDIIATNPPFAGEIVEPNILDGYNISAGKNRIERDVLFIERCINLLKKGGRMAIILPDNIFGSKDNEQIRHWIYNMCRIVGIVGIPRNAFMPHTAVKTSILFLEKRREKRKNSESIFFAISEKPGKDSRGNLIFKNETVKKWKNVDHDLDTIANEFKKFIHSEKIGWL